MCHAVARTLLAVLVISLGCWSAAAVSPARAADDEGQAPAWAQQRLPDWIKPSFLGKHGLPEPWCSRPGPLATAVGGIDRWQANHFIVYRPETAKFLYSKYTPTKVEYHKGLFPALEKIVAQYTKPGQSDREKAMALLTKAMPAHLPHPEVPPLGLRVATNRAMSDEALFASGCGWCNEQTRVYIRLCQIAGVPARMIYLFFSDGKMGHVVTEFYADGHWCMADSSWICVFPDGAPGISGSGRLLSAAELHVPAKLPLVARIYMARWKQILQDSKDPAERCLPRRAKRRFARRKNSAPRRPSSSAVSAC